MTRLLLTLCVLLAGARHGLARLDPASLPDPVATAGTFVYDPSGALSAYRGEIDQVLLRLDVGTPAQIAVAYLPTIGDQVPKDFAVELFEHWGVGHRGSDYGVLLLVVVDQRRAELEVGYGAEAIVTDYVASRTLNDVFVPLMRAGRPGEAVLKTLQRLDVELREGLGQRSEYERGVAFERETELDHRSQYLIVGVLGGLLLVNLLYYLLGLRRIRRTLRRPETLYDKWVALSKMNPGCLGLLVPLGYYALLRPRLRRELERLRAAPRFHPETHEPLRLLSDLDEIDLLSAGALVEQEVRSAEWDVWTDASGEHVLALRYANAGHGFTACPECRFVTYKRTQRLVLEAATYSSAGRRLERHTCRTCGFRKEEEFVIPRKQRSSSSSSGGFSSGGGGSSFGGGSSGGGGAGASW